MFEAEVVSKEYDDFDYMCGSQSQLCKQIKLCHRYKEKPEFCI